MKFILFFALATLNSLQLLAHPMDAGSLKINVQENRAVFALKIHKLAVKVPEELFQLTLQPNPPLLNNEVCEWRTPVQKTDNDYLEMEVVAVCGLARVETESFEMPLPFLTSMHDNFKLLATITGLRSSEINFILTNEEKEMKVNPGALENQSLFLRLGFSHIWPEGIDHVFYILALVLTGSGLWSVIRNATGFTLGHTLSLGLATFKIIHVHTHWVEALIALSISVLIGLYYWKKEVKHGFWLNTALGTLHGLGLASIIHDLELSKEALLPALLSFNLGVEIAQVCIIVVAALVLSALKRVSVKWHDRTVKAGLAIIFTAGLFWFVERAVV